jgi:hypothetical protein
MNCINLPNRTTTVAPTIPIVKPLPPVCTHKRVDLFKSMMNGEEITIMSLPEGKFHTGIVQSITREDNSGYKFLVRLHNSSTIYYVVVM